jgi:DNA-entry nuclease
MKKLSAIKNKISQLSKKKRIALYVSIAVLLCFMGSCSVGLSSDETDPAVAETEATTVASEETTIENTTAIETTTVEETTSAQSSQSTTIEDSNNSDANKSNSSGVGTGKAEKANPSSIPAYSGSAYIVINNNQPNFSKDELKTKGYENYSSLDTLGRCGVAIASVGKDTMPGENEERGSISDITPSGWKQAKYSGISGGYLWNRCHLIGWQLSAENANKQNLITGTRYMNTEGMLPFENMVADYIKETNNHVAYRVTPIFEGSNLVASGVQIEAYSVEDNGEGICFNVYCYNVQPGITINYATGDSSQSGSTKQEQTTTKTQTSKSSGTQSNKTTKAETSQASQAQIVNNDSEKVWISGSGKRYHSNKECSNMKNPTQITIEEAKNQGKEPCSKCYP